jgi:hypothetical protein
VIYIQKPFCYGVLSAGQQHIYDGDKTAVLQHLIVARVRIDTLYFLILSAKRSIKGEEQRPVGSKSG